MAVTTNIKLYKPSGNDYVSVERDLNENYEKIDEAVGNNSNAIAIIIDGNTSTADVIAGNFVFVRNSTITGVTDGLYTANNNVAHGTAFGQADLTAASNGGLNALNDHLAKFDSLIEIQSLTLNPNVDGQGETNVPSNKRILNFIGRGGVYAFVRVVNDNPNGFQLVSYSVSNGTFAKRTTSFELDAFVLTLPTT